MRSTGRGEFAKGTKAKRLNSAGCFALRSAVYGFMQDASKSPSRKGAKAQRRQKSASVVFFTLRLCAFA
jgi:hypothetical protein